jgi:threonine dehydratase
MRETQGVMVHPYDDPRIIAGQGTAALELLGEMPDLDVILVPVGGGGLLSGTAIACAASQHGTRVIGVEPAAADDAYRSLKAGHILPSLDPQTIADGLRTSLSALTFRIIQRHVERIVTVSEDAIIQAMRAVWERMKLIIEPSSAVCVAALVEGSINVSGQRVGIILSGGNVSLDQLPF